MSSFTRCDKCGEVITPKVRNICEVISDKMNELFGNDEPSYRISKVDSSGRLIGSLDLCPTCQEKLVKWIKSGGDDGE